MAVQVRSFLKWAGNKFQILDKIMEALPKGERLIEPFAGSGVVFVNAGYSQNLVAEANPDLINLFKILQVEGKKFIKYAHDFFGPEFNDEARFYELRDRFNASSDKRERSALFIYLNRHGFNGLCRYNSSGGFNVPFGRYTSPTLPEKTMLHFHKKSKQAKFVCADFRKTMQKAKKGDVVYCDPPYVPLSDTAKFTDYSAGGFSEDDQVELAACSEKLANKGIPVLISNHDTPFVRDLYKHAKLSSFPVVRHISRDLATRGEVAEVLALYD